MRSSRIRIQFYQEIVLAYPQQNYYQQKSIKQRVIQYFIKYLMLINILLDLYTRNQKNLLYKIESGYQILRISFKYFALISFNIKEIVVVMQVLKLHQQYKYIQLFTRVMFSKTQFNPTPERISFPEEEQKVLKYWNENQSFKKQLQLTKNYPPFTFYDGPPFATGTPHYGHICAGTIKDVVCRYAAQTQHYVSRRFGWDCHGLPVEYQIDKALNIKDKRQVLQMGIKKYNQQCRSIVMRYSSEWEDVVSRFGRWIDFKNDYKTLDLSFMESVWHVFQTLFKKGLVYRGRKIMPYSNAVHTVLSNFETQQNFKQVDDPSIWITFPLVNDPSVKLVAWTTTPWTLPSNLALAVNADLDYVKIKDLKRDQTFILAECRLAGLYKPKKKKVEGQKDYQVLQKFKGSTLKGLQYTPLFQFFLDRKKDGCFKVFTADFVTSDAGTGIVHCAPGFGEDDYKLCVREKIIHPDKPPVPLNEGGKFTKQIPDYQGIYVKDADKIIIKDLKEKERIVQAESQKHNYPFCWRSDTPLIYKAVQTWFIRVTQLTENLLQNNMKATWVPKSIQEKRFTNWLKDSQDWCFSRNRFWGNPIPLWVSEDGEEIVCVGSVKQLEELTGVKVTDLHREHIDHLTIESKQGKGKLRRIQEVFDCWFESGSMPFAQVHYPFSTNEEEFAKIFPADFIGQGIDQTRGWFYTLNVIATGMKNMNPYKNLIVNGLVLNHEGKKMSKRLKNYPDPMDVVKNFGADAIRLYLINSPLVRADSLNFSQEGVKEVVKNIFLPWYNAYRFLIQNISKLEAKTGKSFVFVQNIEQIQPKFNVTDQWIQSALQTLITQVRKQMQQYKLYNVVSPLVKFLDNLTNWYVRLNRIRIKGDLDDENMEVSINVLFDVLLKTNILMSPLVPFLTDYMYLNMKKCVKPDGRFYQDSIHHLNIPKVIEKLQNEKINQLMSMTTSIIETARKLRQNKNISLKQPIMSLTIVNTSEDLKANLKDFLPYIEQQINVNEILYEKNVEKYVKLTCLPNLPVLGPRFKGNKAFGDVKNGITQLTSEQIKNAREKGQIQIAGQKLSAQEDLIITEKFINDNIQQHQTIGGDKVIVLLDTRQNEELKLKGVSREIINKIQRLKKKAGLKAQDDVFIFYNFDEKSQNLNKALQTQLEAIKYAVKKPIISVHEKANFVNIAHDKGEILGERYEIFITHPHFHINEAALKAQFGQKGHILKSAIMSMPYKKIQNDKVIKIRLDQKDYVIQIGKHYTKL